MATIVLLDGKIVITVTEDGGGSIDSGLARETCPECDLQDCCLDCETTLKTYTLNPASLIPILEEISSRFQYNGGLDAIEALLLSAACAGLITEDNKYKWEESIHTAIDALGQNI